MRHYTTFIVMSICILTAFLPYSFLVYNAPLLLLGQHVFAQGDSAPEDSSGGSETGNGAEPTGGGGGGITEGPSDDSGLTDGTEPTGGGGGTEGPVDEVPNGDNGDVTQFDEFYCNSLTNPPSCHCSGADDCVKMVLSGQCKDDTWKDLDDNFGRCDWKMILE